MKKYFPIILLATLFAGCGDRIELTCLTVEMQDGSQPLATAEPRFSWNYKSEVNNVLQTDYRIIVASSEENARKGIGDLWDSKVVTSNQMLYIPYEGTPLKSRDRCWWKMYTTVTYGNHHRKKTIESKVQQFEISLLSPTDWQAQWIGRDYEDDVLEGHTVVAARYLRKEFELKKDIERARLYICGLGVYSVYINGQEVAEKELLKPALSDYTQRIYFNAYDVTSNLLISGKPTGHACGENKVRNAIGVVLAPGRYTAMRRNLENPDRDGIRNMVHYGTPRMIAQLEVTYTDGSTNIIVSDTSWSITNRGAIRNANEFDGETFDQHIDRLGPWMWGDYTASPAEEWQNAIAVEPPAGRLCPQPNPNIKVQECIKPVALFRKGDSWILDMGQNMVGVLEVYFGEVKEAGKLSSDTITFRFAETLNPDSTLYTDNLRDIEATDRYIGFPIPESYWQPQFVYHGFRYVEIKGMKREPQLNDFRGLVMYDEMPTTGSFECSDPIMNAVYHNATWGIRGNYRSMPTDCPQRDERMGWTGDRTTGCYGESYIFGNHRLYVKWLQDLEDSQRESGSLPDVAPAYWRFYSDNITWPGAFITVADMLFTRFGDIEPVRRHYPAMKRWMLYMKERYMVDGIMTKDTYGDWCVPPESPELIHSKDSSRITEAACISTPFYVHLCELMQGFALGLDLDEDALYFQNEREVATQAYNARYLDTAKGCYANNTVTANILSLWFGMVPCQYEEKVLDNIVEKTENDFGGHVSTGVVGIQQLMRTLTEYGRGDMAYKMASTDTYPSWGYMVRQGATTIWELWNGNTANPAMNSGNHVMLLGDLILWEYEYLGGIRALEPGYSRIELRPYPIEGLSYVHCSYNSVSGRIESHWRRIKGSGPTADRFEWDILIPANTTAEVYLPTHDGYAEKQILTSGRHHLTSTLHCH